MIVSLTIVRYRKPFVPMALFAMALHRLPLTLQKGCSFWKLLGTGKNGTFDLSPDWQQWGLLAAWDNREAFEQFQKSSTIIRWWKRFTTEQWTVLLEPMQSHGKWDGKEPFGKPKGGEHSGPVAVLTRATIRFNRLKNFWAHVDDAAKAMRKAQGYLMSVGIGEAPVYRQATFSIWRSLDDVKAFAYRGKEHNEVIKKTRNENWYSEELFARFRIVDSWGTLQNIDPLNELMSKQ